MISKTIRVPYGIKWVLASLELNFERLNRSDRWQACVSAGLSKSSERELDINVNECTTDPFTHYRSLSLGYSEYKGCGDFAACDCGERRVEIFTGGSAALHDQLPAFRSVFPSMCHVVVNKACDSVMRELADIDA